MELKIGRLTINLAPIIGGIVFYFWQHTILGTIFVIILLITTSGSAFID